MAPKVISTYPPDRWIRTLNQRYPNLWMELKKSYDDPNLPLSPAGKTLLAAVPDWCVMPTMFPCTYRWINIVGLTDLTIILKSQSC